MSVPAASAQGQRPSQQGKVSEWQDGSCSFSGVSMPLAPTAYAMQADPTFRMSPVYRACSMQFYTITHSSPSQYKPIQAMSS
jgi:hypothetical protein